MDPANASNASDDSDADVTNSMHTSSAHPTNGTDEDDADAVDADAFQQLSQGDVLSTNATEIAVDRPHDVLEGPEQSIEFDSQFTDTSSVVVDTFPYGNPGAPIPHMPEGPSPCEQFQATEGERWAPFWSQRDWDVARWIKSHSTTSSAVDRLLALPEVCADHLTLYNPYSVL